MDTDVQTAVHGGIAVAGGLSVQEVIDASAGDVEEAYEEHDQALKRTEQLLKERGAWPEPGWDVVYDLTNGLTVVKCEAMDRVARIVGAYLITHGHGETWRALFPVLLSACDLWDGLEQYGYGDEVKFVSEAGHWRKDAAKDATAKVPA